MHFVAVFWILFHWPSGSGFVFGTRIRIQVLLQNYYKTTDSEKITLDNWEKYRYRYLSFKWLLGFLRHSKPRTILARENLPPVLVFTDGACEGEYFSEVTCGGIVFHYSLKRPEFFGMHVPKETVMRWKNSGLRQVIGQCEIYPVLVAKLTWAKILSGKKAIFFVDNDSAKEALVRNYSPSLPSFELLLANASIDLELELLTWYTRVPSLSNPADAPSRLKALETESTFGAISVEPIIPVIGRSAVLG